MKKLLVICLMLVLILGIAFSFTACGEECEVHKDENEDALCDNCGAVFIDYNKPTVVGTVLKDSLKKQFDEMQSIKIEMYATALIKSDTWYYSAKYENGEESTVAKNLNDYDRYVLDLEIWIAKKGDSFDAKVSASSVESHNENGENEYTDSVTAYIIDGYAYYEMADGIYAKEEFIPEKAQQLIDKLASAKLLPEDKKNELLVSLGAEIATVFNIKDNKGSVSFDAKPSIDKLISYIDALDMEKDTVGKVVDDALALVSPKLTSAAITNELELLSGLTVNEAMAELDAWLTKEYGTTLQDIYDSLLAKPEVISAIEQAIAISEDVDLNDPEIKSEIDAIIEEIKAIKIADLIAEAKVGDILLYDIIMSYVASEMDVESKFPSKSEFFGMVREMLGMTLAEFEENMNIDCFTVAKEIASGITVNKLKARLDLNFMGALQLASIDGVLNIDIESRMPSEVEGKENYEKIALSATLKVSEISNTPSDVTTPTDTAIVERKLLDGRFESEIGTLRTDSYLNGDGELMIRIQVSVYDEKSSSYLSMYGDISYEDIIKDVITAKCVNDSSNTFTQGAVFKFSVNTKTGEFTIIEMPELAK